MNRIKYEGSQHQRRDVYSGGSREGAWGAAPPYFLTTLRPEAWKKFFFWDRVPPSLSQGLDDRATPLSEGVDPPKTGICTRGNPGRGPGGPPSPYFLTKLRPEGWKKFLFLRPGPPAPFTSGSEWPGYPVIWRCGTPTGVGVIKPLSQRRSWDVLVQIRWCSGFLKTNHCPRRRGLPRRFLYLRSIYVENKWLLTFCYNVLICCLFIVLSLATDIVS